MLLVIHIHQPLQQHPTQVPTTVKKVPSLCTLPIPNVCSSLIIAGNIIVPAEVRVLQYRWNKHVWKPPSLGGEVCDG